MKLLKRVEPRTCLEFTVPSNSIRKMEGRSADDGHRHPEKKVTFQATQAAVILLTQYAEYMNMLK